MVGLTGKIDSNLIKDQQREKHRNSTQKTMKVK